MGTVVVGIDGSPCSAAALRWAVEDARAHGRRVQAVLCYETGSSTRHPLGPTMRSAMRDEALALGEGVVRSAGFDPAAVEVVAVPVGPGGIDDALVDRARSADLLVVGSRGLGGVRAAIGSVSRACVERSPVPVVVVREDQCA